MPSNAKNSKSCVKGNNLQLSAVPVAPPLPNALKSVPKTPATKSVKKLGNTAPPSMMDELKSKGAKTLRKTPARDASSVKRTSWNPVVTDDALHNQKQKLKATADPHPKQLTKLDTLSEAELYSISHIIKKVTNTLMFLFSKLEIYF